jgi:hypothetical protein
MNIISKRQRKTVVSYSHQFDWVGERNWGFGFDCDEAGKVDEAAMAPIGLANYRACLDGSMRGEDGRAVVDRGIQCSTRTYMVPAVGQCACGRKVTLDGDTMGEGIDCACGRVYNAVGQELAPRSQWEPDTYGDGW